MPVQKEKRLTLSGGKMESHNLSVCAGNFSPGEGSEKSLPELPAEAINTKWNEPVLREGVLHMRPVFSPALLSNKGA